MEAPEKLPLFVPFEEEVDLPFPPESKPPVRANLPPARREVRPVRVYRGGAVRMAAVPVTVAPPEEAPPQKEAPPPSSPPPPPPDLQAFKATWRARWEAQRREAMQRRIQAAFEEGYRKGAEDMRQQAEHSLHARLQAFLEAWKHTEARMQEGLEALHTEVVTLALQLTEGLLGVPFPEELLARMRQVLLEAIEPLRKETPITVQVHPVDLLAYQEAGLLDYLLQEKPHLEFQANPDLRQGEWVLETPDRAYHRTFRHLLQTLREELGLSPDEEP